MTQQPAGPVAELPENTHHQANEMLNFNWLRDLKYSITDSQRQKIDYVMELCAFPQKILNGRAQAIGTLTTTITV